MIPVTIQCGDKTFDGFAPTADCPLAVSNMDGPWRITHRPTGNRLGDVTFKTRAAAERFLMACEPDFLAWHHAIGKRTDPATVAARYKFELALKARRARPAAASPASVGAT